MRRSLLLLTIAFGLALAVPARAQQAPARSLTLSFEENGLVTLSAANVSLREILAEWARQCGCYVVNWDRLTGGPLPIPMLFERQTQRNVLEAILRSAAGYVLTPKRAGSRSVSNYETIYIVPTTTAVAGTYVAPTPTFMPLPTPGAPEDEIPGLPSSPPPGARPEGPNLPNRPGMPTAAPPGMPPGTPGGPPRPGGAPSVFVPIVPVTSSPSTSPVPRAAAPPPPGTVPPGASTAPPPMPVPIVPAPAR